MGQHCNRLSNNVIGDIIRPDLTSPNRLPILEKAALVFSPADLKAWLVFCSLSTNVYRNTLDDSRLCVTNIQLGRVSCSESHH